MNNKILASVVKTIFVPKGNPDIKEVREIQAVPFIKNVEGDMDELTVTGEMELRLVYLPIDQAEKNIPWREIDLEKAENEKYQDCAQEGEDNDWRQLEEEMAQEKAGFFKEDRELNLLVPFTTIMETRTMSRDPVMKFVPTVHTVNWTVVSPKAVECEMILNLGEKEEMEDLPMAERPGSDRETEVFLTDIKSEYLQDTKPIELRTEINKLPQEVGAGEQPVVGDKIRHGSWEEPTNQTIVPEVIRAEKGTENDSMVKETCGIQGFASDTVMDPETSWREKESDTSVVKTVENHREADAAIQVVERELADPLPEAGPKRVEEKAGDQQVRDTFGTEAEKETSDPLPEAGAKRVEEETGDQQVKDTFGIEAEKEPVDPLPETGSGPVGVTYSYRESPFLMPSSSQYYQIKFYRVQFGEDLDAIADKLGIPKESIQRVNSISEEEIRAGTLLSIPTNSA